VSAHSHSHSHCHCHSHSDSRSHLDRRDFILSGIGLSLVCGLADNEQRRLRGYGGSAAKYDLLIKGGWVVDASQNLSGKRDVGIVGSKIARIAPELPSSDGQSILDAEGKLVTRGLIDVHLHSYVRRRFR